MGSLLQCACDLYLRLAVHPPPSALQATLLTSHILYILYLWMLVEHPSLVDHDISVLRRCQPTSFGTGCPHSGMRRQPLASSWVDSHRPRNQLLGVVLAWSGGRRPGADPGAVQCPQRLGMRMGRWPLAEPRSLEEIVALLKSETPPVAAPRRL